LNRILIIEDEIDLYNMISLRLIREDYTIVKSINDDYNVVILDYGSMSYKKFDKNNLIIISGLNINLKGYNFLMKPFRMKELISMIEKIQKT